MSGKKEKDLVIIINSLSKGGAERIASELGFYAENNGFNVIFLTTDQASIEYELSKNSIIITLPFARFSRTFVFPFVILIQGLYIRVKFGNSIKAISFLHRANLVNGVATFLTKRDLIISERSVFNKSYKGNKRKLMKRLLSPIYKKAHKIIAVSEYVKKELLTEFKIKPNVIDVIYNPVNVDSFSFSKKESNFLVDHNKLQFCVVGRLISSKRVHIAIDLFEKLLPFFTNACLNIIGDGSEREFLENLVKSKGLVKKVVFHGKKDDVGGFIKKFDVMLFTSSYESFGNVAIEATSVGLPLIYTSNLEPLKEIYKKTNTLALEIDFFMKRPELEIQTFIKKNNFSNFQTERLIFLNDFNSEVNFSKYINILK